MSVLDGLLLAGVLAFGLWRLLARRAGRRVREVAGLALAGLALLQLVRDDFTWQFLPAYALIVAAAAIRA